MGNVPGRLINSQHITPFPTSWAHGSQANHPQQALPSSRLQRVPGSNNRSTGRRLRSGLFATLGWKFLCCQIMRHLEKNVRRQSWEGSLGPACQEPCTSFWIPSVDDRKPLKVFRLETNTNPCRHGSPPQCCEAWRVAIDCEKGGKEPVL